MKKPSVDTEVFGDEPHLAGGVTVAVTVPARLLQRRHQLRTAVDVLTESRGQVIDLSPKIRIGKRKSALASVSFLGATPRWRAGRADSRRRGRPAVHRAPRRNGHRSLPRPGGARWRWRLHTGDSCRDA